MALQPWGRWTLSIKKEPWGFFNRKFLSFTLKSEDYTRNLKFWTKVEKRHFLWKYVVANSPTDFFVSKIIYLWNFFDKTARVTDVVQPFFDKNPFKVYPFSAWYKNYPLIYILALSWSVILTCLYVCLRLRQESITKVPLYIFHSAWRVLSSFIPYNNLTILLIFE